MPVNTQLSKIVLSESTYLGISFEEKCVTQNILFKTSIQHCENVSIDQRRPKFQNDGLKLDKNYTSRLNFRHARQTIIGQRIFLFLFSTS